VPLWHEVLKDRIGPERDWSVLLRGENAERIRSVLVQQANDVNGQIAARKAAMEALHTECMAGGPAGRQRWREAKADHDDWRTRALYFKRRLEIRMAEARRAHEAYRRDRHVATTADTTRAQREVIRQLTLAVAQHQRNCALDRLQPSMRLWGVLDELSVPHGGGESTLSTLADTVWHDS
jgi:hypothetical protein